jgi:putative nucleotidyltransferase with HDIG domain
MDVVFVRFLPSVVWPERRVLIYVGGLVAGATAMVAALLASGLRPGPPLAVITLAAIAIGVERQSIRLSPTIEASVAALPFIFAGVAYGPLSAVIVGAAGVLVDLFRTDDAHPRLRWMAWTANRTIVAGGAGLVALAVGGVHSHSFGVILLAVAAACIAEAVIDLILSSATIVVRRRGSFRDLAQAMGPLLLASIPLYTPLIAVLAYSYREISPWSAALFVIPAFAAQRLFLMYRQQRDSAEELVTANERLERANLSFASALVATLDARDRYTAGHSAAVAVYSRDIAARMGLTPDQQELVHLCGLVHDIGKIGLPVGLLEKVGPLTLEERRQMEAHAEIGQRILEKVEDYAEIANIVRHHHERVDGQGYPDRLSGAAIPLLSRIIAVADAYNAMTSDRPYRDAMPSRVARMRLAQAVETQFDTSVVAAFEAILAGASEDYRSASRDEFKFGAEQGYEPVEIAAAS